MPKKKKHMKYIGNLKFDAQQYDLASIPDNETAKKDAEAIMPLIRVAAVLLNDSDKGLAKKIREGGELDPWLDLLEGLLAAAQHKKQEYDLLNAGYIRLQVVLERIVGKNTVERCYSN